MTITDAKKIIGNRPVWELRNMKKALSFLEAFNTPEENERLKAVKVLLAHPNKRGK